MRIECINVVSCFAVTTIIEYLKNEIKGIQKRVEKYGELHKMKNKSKREKGK